MKKVKVGIVGLGRLGRKHAENIAFRIPNAELHVFCEKPLAMNLEECKEVY